MILILCGVDKMIKIRRVPLSLHFSGAFVEPSRVEIKLSPVGRYNSKRGKEIFRSRFPANQFLSFLMRNT